MRLVRGLSGVLLWIGASLLGLVAVLLCVTVILLPVGLPLLRLAGKSYGSATRLMLPRPVAHPVKESKRGLRGAGGKAKDKVSDASPKDTLSKGRKKLKKKTGRKRLFG